MTGLVEREINGAHGVARIARTAQKSPLAINQSRNFTQWTKTSTFGSVNIYQSTWICHMNNLSARFSLTALSLVLLLIFGMDACTLGQTHRAIGEDLIATATTKADHEAIADHYDQQAEEALEKVELMRKHLESYESSGTNVIPRQKAYFIQHCKSLIYGYKDIARDNEELAKLHREIAENW
jgi:hypothetical protein